MSKPKYDVNHFSKLLQMATSGEFLYRDGLYRQVDGVAMGSLLAPTLANLFLAHLEQDWLKTKCAPIAYFRYVDDVFCLFDSSSQNHEIFLDFLNKQHTNIRFTFEVGPSSLPFLDVSVQLDSLRCPIFTVFRKETYTGLLLNYRAFCPFAWKKALIMGFLKRAFTVCSNWFLFHQEVMTLRNYFTRNGYPQELFERVLNVFLTKHAFTVHTNTCNKPACDTEPNLYTLVLPYFGIPSDKFGF